MDTTEFNLDAWHRLRWERDSRYYLALVRQDLWGSWIVTRVWGQIGSPLGNQRDDPAPNYQEALAILDSIARRRAQRGYQPVAEQNV